MVTAVSPAVNTMSPKPASPGQRSLISARLTVHAVREVNEGALIALPASQPTA